MEVKLVSQSMQIINAAPLEQTEFFLGPRIRIYLLLIPLMEASILSQSKLHTKLEAQMNTLI